MKELFNEIGKAMIEGMNMEQNLSEQRKVNEPKLFRVHCSQIWKIMSPAKKAGELSQTCITHLKEFYSGDREEIYSKYTNKGYAVEQENIDFMARVLGYGLAEKNKITMSDEFVIGECDVDLPDCIVDVKSPWSRKTFLDSIHEMDTNHEWQGRGYLRLWRKDRFIVFIGLMDTPATEYDDEVIYSDLPDQDRWIAYEIRRDESIEAQIVGRVLQCREWLEAYDKLVKGRTGRVIVC